MDKLYAQISTMIMKSVKDPTQNEHWLYRAKTSLYSRNRVINYFSFEHSYCIQEIDDFEPTTAPDKLY